MMMFLGAVLVGCASTSAGRIKKQGTPQARSPPQSFIPAAGQTFYLDLDTAEGTFSRWGHNDLGGVSAMRATVRIPRLRKDPKWNPAFTLWLEQNETVQARHKIGLQFVAPDREPPLVISVVQGEDGELVSTETLDRTLALNESLIVEMTWLTPHVVKIRFRDSEVHEVNIPWSIDSVGVTASTGELIIDPLELGGPSK